MATIEETSAGQRGAARAATLVAKLRPPMLTPFQVDRKSVV